MLLLPAVGAQDSFWDLKFSRWCSCSCQPCVVTKMAGTTQCHIPGYFIPFILDIHRQPKSIRVKWEITVLVKSTSYVNIVRMSNKRARGGGGDHVAYVGAQIIACRLFMWNPKINRPFEDLGIDGGMWTGFIWLRIWTNSLLLWTQHWTLRLCKM
jgi:hypothetical protein